MREMKDSGIEWIGEIPKDWEVHPVHAYFEEGKTKNYRMQEQNLLSLSYGGIIRKDINTNGGLLPASFNTYNVIEAGDIIIRPTDLQNDKRSLRTGLVKEQGIITSAYIDLRPKDNVNSKYYHYLLHSYDIIKVFYNMGNGVRQGLNFSEFAKLLLLEPTTVEQQQIANFLDTKCSEIDATAEDIKKEISLLEDYKTSVITEAVTKGLNPDVEMKDSGIEYIGITPIHWNKYRLKYILLERNIRTITGEEMLLSVSQYKGVVPSKDIYNRTMQANSLIGYKIVKKDDLVFNKLNPGLARFGNSEFDGITSPDFSVYIVDDKKCTAKFLQHLLKTYKYVAKIKGDCTGVGDGFARLYSEQLYRFVVSLPPIEELHSIVAYIDSKCSEIDTLIADKKRQLDILTDYKKSLIYEYITGKKEVPVKDF